MLGLGLTVLPQLFPKSAGGIWARGVSPPSPALLALADGHVFHGVSIGAPGVAVAEVVFNTGMTGYQEILTDPSYSGQIVTLTTPHIGNTGVNLEDSEARRVFAAGLVVRDCPALMSSFRATCSLPDYLKAQAIVAIAGIDTRKLTRILREKGAQSACIWAGEGDSAQALELARGFPGMAGQDLAQTVSLQTPCTWTEGTWRLGHGFSRPAPGQYHVVVYDFGVKVNMLRLMVDRGCRITVVPAQTSVEDVLAYQPDGLFLANGPGDPEPCAYAIAATQAFLARKLPVFGICFGHQILGLAVGAKTSKMKTGHHGSNHPVQDVVSKRVFITSQNHGFEVDAASLPSHARVTHISLFDGSLQGFELTDRPAFCFQGHPEASPGPHDILPLFDKFVQQMASQDKPA